MFSLKKKNDIELKSLHDRSKRSQGRVNQALQRIWCFLIFSKEGPLGSKIPDQTDLDFNVVYCWRNTVSPASARTWRQRVAASTRPCQYLEKVFGLRACCDYKEHSCYLFLKVAYKYDHFLGRIRSSSNNNWVLDAVAAEIRGVLLHQQPCTALTCSGSQVFSVTWRRRLWAKSTFWR